MIPVDGISIIISGSTETKGSMIPVGDRLHLETTHATGNGKLAVDTYVHTLEAPGQMHVHMSVSSGVSCTLMQILEGEKGWE